MFDNPYYWLPQVPLDEVREQRGINIRNNFAAMLDVSQQGIFLNEMNGTNCSILEMMVALSIDINDMMVLSDDTYFEYFWMMIDNLHLDWAKDTDFDMDIVSKIFDDLLSRKYENGGMFRKNFCGSKWDLSNDFVDLYTQASQYFAKYK